MKTRKNEFAIGLSVTIATVIVIFTILWLGKSNFLVKGLHLNMIVQDAHGLSIGDEILYKGMAVGAVQDAVIETNDILIRLKIEKAPPLPKDSRFIIKSINLLGEMAVEIIPGKSSDFLNFGETVNGETEQGISELVSQGKHLKTQLDSILQNINTLSGKNTSQNINRLINAWIMTSQNLNEIINGDLKMTIANIKEISEQNKQPIHSILDTLGRNSEAIGATIRNLQAVTQKLNILLSKIQNGVGTLGKLSSEDTLYRHFDSTVKHLDSLIIDIKKNPNRYFEVKVF